MIIMLYQTWIKRDWR